MLDYIEEKSDEWSPPSRGAWIEITGIPLLRIAVTSPPSRGAWIEIQGRWHWQGIKAVAPLAGGVD